MSRVLIRPDGARVEVEDDKVVDAVANGYVPAPPAEQKRLAAGQQTGEAALEGAGRGAFMGLSDAFAKGRGDDMEMRQLRKEENPLASVGGELGGLVGAALLSKKIPTPAGLVTEGANLGMKAQGAPSAVRAVVAGTEGSLYGLGQAISENALEDKPLTGEKILASGGGGALAGAGAGVVFGKAGDLGGKLLEKALGGKALERTLKETADTVFIRQFITGKGDLRKYGRGDRVEDFADFARKKGWLTKGATVEQVGSAAQRHMDEVLAPIFDRQFARLGQKDVFVDMKPILSRIRKEIVAPLADDPTTAPRADQLEAWLGRLEDRIPMQAGPPVPVTKPSTILSESGAPFETTAMVPSEVPGPFTFQKLWEIQKAMRQKVGPMDPNESFKKDLWRARGTVLDEMFKQLETKAGVEKHVLKAAKDEWGMSSFFVDQAEEKAIQKMANASIGLRDTVVGAGAVGAMGAFGGPVGAMAGGAVGAVGTKLARERGPFLVAAAADALANSKVTSNMTKALKKLLDEKFNVLGPAAAPWRAALELAGAEGGSALLEKHLELAQTDPNYMATMGFNHEDPETSKAAVARGMYIAQIQDAAEAYDGEVDRAVGRFIGSQPGRAPAREKPDVSEFVDRVNELEKMVNDQEYLTRKLPSDLIGLAPGVGVSVFETSQRAAEFLYSKAPKPDAVLMPALQKPFMPADGDVEKWMRYAAAVQDPLGVLEQLRDPAGPSPEGIETLQTVYPRLYEDFRKKTMDRLADLKDPIDYEKKLALQAMFGEDIGGVRGQTELLQSMHKVANQKKEAGGGPQPDGRQSVDVEANMQTQGQRLEQRGQK